MVLRDITERVLAEQHLHGLLVERSRVAAALQASLVPGELPLIPAAEVASRYEPAGDGREIGGDFFDVFTLGDDRWGLVLGDVSGKGAEAAAVTALALQQPELAAAIALILLACGIALVIFVWTRIRRAWTLLRQRYGSRAPP